MLIRADYKNVKDYYSVDLAFVYLVISYLNYSSFKCMGPFIDVKDKTKSATTYTKVVYSQWCKGTHLSPITFQQGFKGVRKKGSFIE